MLVDSNNWVGAVVPCFVTYVRFRPSILLDSFSDRSRNDRAVTTRTYPRDHHDGVSRAFCFAMTRDAISNAFVEPRRCQEHEDPRASEDHATHHRLATHSQRAVPSLQDSRSARLGRGYVADPRGSLRRPPASRLRELCRVHRALVRIPASGELVEPPTWVKR